MTCSTCEVIRHYSRGCHKFQGASKTRPLKFKKQKKDKRHRTLIDEEDVDPIPPSYQTVEKVEDLSLTTPQPSQDSALSQSLFGSSPAGLDFEEDIPWRPRSVSEFKSRILQRQNQSKPTETRQINFFSDSLVTPSEFYTPKGLSWKGNASITGRQLQQLRVEKLQTTKGKGNY